MSLVGDVERFVAQLWPYRVPIAIALFVAAGILGYVAWRRGWFAVARAHPGTTLLAGALVLAVGGPAGWILGSPLLIRTELVEAPAAAGSPSAVLLEGEFVGADDFHFGSGQARLVETDEGKLVLSFEDLSVLNGPDLFVYVSPDPEGWTEDAVNLGALKATDGSFGYEVPADVDPGNIASAVIWCRAFAVLFATATLEPPSD